MAAEFYRKSTALYEEFKRRELHYFNVERSVNSNYFSKSDTHSSLQDYMERINKREKETEKSYKDLLKHLEEMDKSTDQISIKLEKLNALRNAAISSTYTPWPASNNTFERPPFMSYYGNSFQERATTSFSPSVENRRVYNNPTSDYSPTKLNCRSESTQTEHVFCEKCHYPFTGNVTISTSSTATEPISYNKIVREQHMSNNPLNSNQNIYNEIGQIMKSSVHNTTSEQINQKEAISEEHMDDYHFSLKSNQDVHNEIEALNPKLNLGRFSPELLQSSALTSTPFKNTMVQEDRVAGHVSKPNPNFNNPKVPLTTGGLVAETKNSNLDSMQNLNSNHKRNSLTDARVSLDTRITSEPEQITTHQKEVKDSSVRQSSVGDITMNHPVDTNIEVDATENTSLAKSEMFEKAASKSDDESINHEFDFLESDRRHSMKSKVIEPEISESSRVYLPENISSNTRLENGSLKINSVKSSIPELSNASINKNLLSTESFLTADDTKGESSLSEGLPSPVHHSADVSNHSESESLSDKETPFTASAAYQALLGNVAATKSAQKVPSLTDSESEDEIENAYALAAAPRKSSNINFDALIQVQKKEERKESVSDVILKTEKKISKPVSVGNTQNKLSKNTRKVLGLDASSGSEVELETKPTVNKIDEDSDEFDFYN